MAERPSRGRCPACRRQARVSKDGTIGSHFARVSRNVAMPCPGAGQAPVPLMFDDETGLPDCGDCAMEMYSDPMLTEAVCSVSIETGGSPQKMLRDLLAEYHVSGHASL